MPLSMLEAHEQSCPHEIVECGARAVLTVRLADGGQDKEEDVCVHRCRRRDLDSHKAVCPFRLVECPRGCGIKLPAQEAAAHAAACASRMVQCTVPGCGASMHFSQLAAHNMAAVHDHLAAVQVALQAAQADAVKMALLAASSKKSGEMPSSADLHMLVPKLVAASTADAAVAGLVQLALLVGYPELGATICGASISAVNVAYKRFPEDAAVRAAALDLLTATVQALRVATRRPDDQMGSQQPVEQPQTPPQLPQRTSVLDDAAQRAIAALMESNVHASGSSDTKHRLVIAAAARLLSVTTEAALEWGVAAMDALRAAKPQSGNFSTESMPLVYAAACKALDTYPSDAAVAAPACKALATLFQADGPVLTSDGQAIAQAASRAARAALRISRPSNQGAVAAYNVQLHALRTLMRCRQLPGENDAPGDVFCAVFALQNNPRDCAIGAAALAVLRLACGGKGRAPGGDAGGSTAGCKFFLTQKGYTVVSNLVMQSGCSDMDVAIAAAELVTATCLQSDTETDSGMAPRWLASGAPVWLVTCLRSFNKQPTACAPIMEAIMTLMTRGRHSSAPSCTELELLRRDAQTAFLAAGLASCLTDCLHTAAASTDASMAGLACLIVRKLGYTQPAGVQAMAASRVPASLADLLRTLTKTYGGIFPPWKGHVQNSHEMFAVAGTYSAPPSTPVRDKAGPALYVLSLTALALSTFVAGDDDNGRSTAVGEPPSGNVFGVGAPPAQLRSAMRAQLLEVGALAAARDVANKVGLPKGAEMAEALASALA